MESVCCSSVCPVWEDEILLLGKPHQQWQMALARARPRPLHCSVGLHGACLLPSVYYDLTSKTLTGRGETAPPRPSQF